MGLKIINKEEAAATPDDNILIAIDNGDLKALGDVVNEWGFKDKASALRFGMAVLFLARADKKISVSESGKERSIVPVDSLMKQKEAIALPIEGQA
jgi:hypothetical protein